MAEIRKVLGQSNPAAATLTDAYTVPAATEAVVSSVVVCNRSAISTKFRVSVAINGAGSADPQFLYSDVTIAGGETFVATLGITLGAADVVRVYAEFATLSFNIFGAEIS